MTSHQVRTERLFGCDDSPAPVAETKPTLSELRHQMTFLLVRVAALEKAEGV